ncbi:Mce family protein [Gordonia effusa NBRC 100432]|uniref:Mce family protein n=1 Tax=Gordonia effusa NBRC 100432 TaxID=1077974 RepID=H0QYS3_9ACTN|nr:MlaD family protein [Gordonia effusa]GAB17974.1 Mce family protein [Gordonia effusa NBRC 100432]
MKSPVRSFVYLLVFALVAVGGGLFIANGVSRPIAGQTETYTAEFTNVSGLRVGNDVRTLGTRVGKVTDVELSSDDTTALVTFTLVRDQHVYGDSKLAIRYLNLTGIRYLDLQQRSGQGTPRSPGEPIGLESTTPSYDITTVFHGLAPVFAVMDPADINHFSESLLALIQGDGTGFGEVLDSLTRVLQFVDDRSALVNTLVYNLSKVSGALGGRAGYVGQLIAFMKEFGAAVAKAIPSVREYADSTGNVIIAIDRLFAAMGLRPNNTPDANAVVRQALPIARSVIGVLSLTPGLLNALNNVLPASGPASTPLTCSKGRAQLPASVAIFLRGSQVTLCKK